MSLTTCPVCGAEATAEYDEVDIGVGIMRGLRGIECVNGHQVGQRSCCPTLDSEPHHPILCDAQA